MNGREGAASGPPGALSGSRAPIVAFVALAFFLSWAAWTPLVLAAAAGRPLNPLFHVLGNFGPAAAALIVSALTGRHALRQVLRSLAAWRAPPAAWLFALGAPAILWLVGVLLSPGEPLAAFLKAPEFPGLGFLALLVVELVAYGVGEELGWRGFLLPRLSESRSLLSAALLVAVVWEAWHLPLLYALPTFRALGIGGLFGWAFSLALGSVLMAWLSRLSGASTPVLATFHGLLDIAMGGVGVSLLAMNAQGGLVMALGAAVLLAGGLTGRWRQRGASRAV